MSVDAPLFWTLRWLARPPGPLPPWSNSTTSIVLKSVQDEINWFAAQVPDTPPPMTATLFAIHVILLWIASRFFLFYYVRLLAIAPMQLQFAWNHLTLPASATWQMRSSTRIREAWSYSKHSLSWTDVCLLGAMREGDQKIQKFKQDQPTRRKEGRVPCLVSFLSLARSAPVNNLKKKKKNPRNFFSVL